MLQFTSVTYTYPHATTPAVQDITFSLAPGEAMLCTGRSGCGKSTLTRLANGLAPHYMHGVMHGDVLVGGHNTLSTTPAELAQHVGSLFQDPERQFFALTVGDELALSLQWQGWDPDKIKTSVAESAHLLGIEELMGHTIFGLSEGQKQKVALASLLALRPGLLVLDEPTANLDPESTQALSHTLAALKKQGIALFVVDHRLHWMRDLADKVLVLDGGTIAAQGDFSILDDAAIRENHGLRAANVADARSSLPTMPLADCDDSFFACRDLAFSYLKGQPIFSRAEYAFSPGRIIALLGENGAGKTTLSRLLTGLEKPQQGAVLAQGQTVKPRQLARHAQVVLQNAGHQLHMNSVEGELEDSARGTVAEQDLAATVATCLEDYGLTHLARRHPQSLSGGEKQRLAVACAVIRKPQMLILDEPTSGLDGENMRRMAQSMEHAAKTACLLVITHDLELMQLVCTEKIVLHKNTGATPQ